jgi:hypothetical protein
MTLQGKRHTRNKAASFSAVDHMPCRKTISRMKEDITTKESKIWKKSETSK